jgi:hypothetical protein
MIKINLLPAHILERQRIRSVIILAAAVIILEIAVLGIAMMRVKGQLADANAELEYWKTQAGQVTAFDASIQSTNGQALFYGRWVMWDAMIQKYHEAWADNLGEFAKWIYEKMQVDSLLPTPQQVQIQGRTDSLSSFRRAYLNIIRCPRYANVAFSISGVTGGYVQGQTGAGATPARPRPAAGAFGGPRQGIQIRFGRGRTGSAAGPVFGAPRTMAFGQRAPGAAGLQPLAAFNRLPVGVTFTCLLRPEYGFQLNPPQPPVGGAPVGVAGRGGAAAPGRRSGGIQIRFGRGRGG